MWLPDVAAATIPSVRLLRRLGPAFAGVLVATASLTPQACGSVCVEEPACDSGEREVSSCRGEPSCREARGPNCEVTIFCVPDLCEDVPECDGDRVQVPTCPPGLTCVDATACDATIQCAPLHLGPCGSNDDCGEGTFCNFADGQCGAGSAGECQPVPAICDEGRSYCYCDGTVSTKDEAGCAGRSGQDFDSSGGCVIPSTSFPCGHAVCDKSENHYCNLVDDAAGLAPHAGCVQAGVDCSPPTCACLADDANDCGGSCVDGPNGPTLHCPPD